MIAFDPTIIDSQRTGRMGELVVELELIARGWHVGNFNASTANSAGWDLFAAKAGRSVKLRVKAKRPGTDCFRWSAKPDGTIFLGLAGGDDADFVAAVSFEPNGTHDVYLVPTCAVDRELRENHARYLAKPKRNGEDRKDGSQRNLHLNERVDAPGHGYLRFWAPFKNRWDFAL